MAYDEGHAEILREHLESLQGIEEKKMFGGLCFMLNGNMLCGVHKGGAMFRVGKDNEQAALAIEGTSPLSFTKKKMGGMLDVEGDLLENDDRRAALMTLALHFVGNLPAK
jgi:TfoX/Sxy family transcriptional regulator of competence genes